MIVHFIYGGFALVGISSAYTMMTLKEMARLNEMLETQSLQTEKPNSLGEKFQKAMQEPSVGAVEVPMTDKPVKPSRVMVDNGFDLSLYDEDTTYGSYNRNPRSETSVEREEELPYISNKEMPNFHNPIEEKVVPTHKEAAFEIEKPTYEEPKRTEEKINPSHSIVGTYDESIFDEIIGNEDESSSYEDHHYFDSTSKTPYQEIKNDAFDFYTDNTKKQEKTIDENFGAKYGLGIDDKKIYTPKPAYDYSKQKIEEELFADIHSPISTKEEKNDFEIEIPSMYDTKPKNIDNKVRNPYEAEKSITDEILGEEESFNHTIEDEVISFNENRFSGEDENQQSYTKEDQDDILALIREDFKPKEVETDKKKGFSIFSKKQEPLAPEVDEDSIEQRLLKLSELMDEKK